MEAEIVVPAVASIEGFPFARAIIALVIVTALLALIGMARDMWPRANILRTPRDVKYWIGGAGVTTGLSLLLMLLGVIFG